MGFLESLKNVSPFSSPLQSILKPLQKNVLLAVDVLFVLGFGVFLPHFANQAKTQNSNSNSEMGFFSGSSKGSWHPELTSDTTAPKYWLNWRAIACAIWVLLAMIFASFLISRFEGPRNPRVKEQRGRGEEEEEDEQVDNSGILYEDEVWKPCIKGIHPAWLLAYRTLAFFVLLILLILNVALDGADIMYYYTQWTFTLVTIYFGLGSLLSMYGCYQYHNKVGINGIGNEWIDSGQGNNAALSNGNPKSFNVQANRNHLPRKIAGFWAYVFQIIFQMNAGAVMPTDCVFWFIIVPFLATKNYDINFLIVNMHTINVVFLLGDTAMNCLRFPWLRIAYFILWTCFCVIFQWILHACIFLWWPYPFLDLSQKLAPLWFFAVGVMHLLCFVLFVLVIKMKHALLSKYFPQSYQCARLSSYAKDDQMIVIHQW